MGRAKRICYLSTMRAAKVQASLRFRAVSPEPSLLAHTSSESRGTFRQKTRSLAPLNGWACAVKICHDGMLEDTNSLVAAHMKTFAFTLFCIAFGLLLKLNRKTHSSHVYNLQRHFNMNFECLLSVTSCLLKESTHHGMTSLNCADIIYQCKFNGSLFFFF